MSNRAAPGEAGTAGPYSYRNLALWQAAQASAGSIAANIAEGHGRYSVAAYRNHLSIARGSVAETDSWLDLLQRAGYIAPDAAADLHGSCQQLMGGLTRQMKALEARLRDKGTGAVREGMAEYVESETLGD